MLKTVFENPWVRAAGLVVTLAVAVVLLYLLSPVLVPLFFAFLVAYILDPVVDFFEARRIPRAAAIGALGVVAVLIILSIPLFVIPGLISEAKNLTEATPAAQVDGDNSQNPAGGESPETDGQSSPRSRLTGLFDNLLEMLPLEKLVRSLGWADPGQPIDARAVLAQRIGAFVEDNASSLLKSYGMHIVAAGQGAGKGLAYLMAAVGRRTSALLVFLGNMAIFAFVAGYLLKDFDGLLAGARELVPPRYRPKTLDILAKIDVQIRSFLRGQLIVCICLGLMYALGLRLSGVPLRSPPRPLRRRGQLRALPGRHAHCRPGAPAGLAPARF